MCVVASFKACATHHVCPRALNGFHLLRWGWKNFVLVGAEPVPARTTMAAALDHDCCGPDRQRGCVNRLESPCRGARAHARRSRSSDGDRRAHGEQGGQSRVRGITDGNKKSAAARREQKASIAPPAA